MAGSSCSSSSGPCRAGRRRLPPCGIPAVRVARCRPWTSRSLVAGRRVPPPACAWPAAAWGWACSSAATFKRRGWARCWRLPSARSYNGSGSARTSGTPASSAATVSRRCAAATGSGSATSCSAPTGGLAGGATGLRRHALHGSVGSVRRRPPRGRGAVLPARPGSWVAPDGRAGPAGPELPGEVPGRGDRAVGASRPLPWPNTSSRRSARRARAVPRRDRQRDVPHADVGRGGTGRVVVCGTAPGPHLGRRVPDRCRPAASIRPHHRGGVVVAGGVDAAGQLVAARPGPSLLAQAGRRRLPAEDTDDRRPLRSGWRCRDGLGPLSGQGVYRAPESGMQAAEGIRRVLGGDPDGLLDYAAWAQMTYEAYRRERRRMYRLEQRWPGAVFWARRHQAPASPGAATLRSGGRSASQPARGGRSVWSPRAGSSPSRRGDLLDTAGAKVL
jgi:hypothetical protein